MSLDGRRIAGAAAGGLVAGLGITALLLWQERHGTPSEVTRLERTGLARLGEEARQPDQPPTPTEQAWVQGGHLALSVLAGAAYGAATPRGTGLLAGGTAFGALLYGALHWLVGPVLRVKPPEWRAPRAELGMHAVNHLVFGLVTAAAAEAAGRGRRRLR